jgi:hypothetical protein
MLSDWSLEQPTRAHRAAPAAHAHRARLVRALAELSQGLLGRNPQWNFIDWSATWDDRTTFPSWGKERRQLPDDGDVAGSAAPGALETAYGDAQQGAVDAARPSAARAHPPTLLGSTTRLVRRQSGPRCFQPAHERVCSAYDVATPEEAPEILQRSR